MINAELLDSAVLSRLDQPCRDAERALEGLEDAAVGIDAAGKVYCLFAQTGTNAAVGISSDQGQTWDHIYDVGAGLSLTNVAFPAAIGGDAGRVGSLCGGASTAAIAHHYALTCGRCGERIEAQLADSREQRAFASACG